MKWLNRILKEENGQDVVEFAMVLPLFLLLIMGIIDFGWMFFNYISVANSARNAARIACVEYVDVAIDKVSAQGGGFAKVSANGKVYTYDLLDVTEGAANALTNEEADIVKTVKNTLPGSVDNVAIKVDYTYDDSEDAERNGFAVEKRSNGDVTVTVTGRMRVLTPVLGVTADHMMKDIESDATFKVEKQFNSD